VGPLVYDPGDQWHAHDMTCLFAQVANSMNAPEGENVSYLPGFKIPLGLTATTDLSATITNSEIVLMVVPTPFIASVLGRWIYAHGAGFQCCDLHLTVMVCCGSCDCHGVLWIV
jgi:glycerol-3-phosphate dehydrogenase